MSDWRAFRRVLWAPQEYWSLSDEEHAATCNGCGAAQARWDFVPDTFYGLRMTQVCNIHDFMYSRGTTAGDKVLADLTMLLNCVRLIHREGGLLETLRYYRAMTYFVAVHRYGDAAYWAGKSNDPRAEKGR